MSPCILMVDARVRYWEDAEVNGVSDDDGNLIPCRVGNSWMPSIDLASGKILGWLKGTEADIHYKVCECAFALLKCSPIGNPENSSEYGRVAYILSEHCQGKEDVSEAAMRIFAERIECLERERDEAREDAERWESSSDAMERAGAEQARRADENREWALKAERERDELESALRRLLNADIPRPLGGIIDDDERKAAIEWNAFERGEARQHAKAILQQNKEEAK